MKPNLLKFANECHLSTKPVSYSVVTGEMNPDYGFFLPHEIEEREAVDKDQIREFYNKHKEVLVKRDLFLCIWRNWGAGQKGWCYAVVEHIGDLGTATNKANERGALWIVDCAKGEVLYRGLDFE